MIAAEANEDLSRSRYWLPLVGLAAVALVLLAIYRSAAPGAGAAGADRAGDRLVSPWWWR